MEEKKLLSEEELGIASGTAEQYGSKISAPGKAMPGLPDGRDLISGFTRDEYHRPVTVKGTAIGIAAKVLDDSAVAGAVAGTAEDVVPDGKDRIIHRRVDEFICNASSEYVAGGVGGPSRNALVKSEYAEDDTAHYGSKGANGVIIVT